MEQDNIDSEVTPKNIGNFNIPKAVIENKVDTLAFLEILVRKQIISTTELDEIRAAVVAHLNQLYPELELSYTTPEALASQAPLPESMIAQPEAGSEGVNQAPAKPLYHSASPPKFI